MLIDTHCHLTFPELAHSARELKVVVDRAREAGIKQLITVGVNGEDSLKAYKFAKAFPDIFCTFGVHPNEAENWNPKVGADFLKVIQEGWKSGVKNVVAIGEIGLDYYRKRTAKDLQQEVFRLQLQFARKVQLPVIVHCREAFPDTIRILEEEAMESVVFHCFSGDLKTARRIWANDWYTSFTATLTYPDQEELRGVLEVCPEEQYFFETDSPFLPPEGLRGKRNEPVHLVKLAEYAAVVRSQSFEQVAWQSSKNAGMFFGLPPI